MTCIAIIEHTFFKIKYPDKQCDKHIGLISLRNCIIDCICNFFRCLHMNGYRTELTSAYRHKQRSRNTFSGNIAYNKIQFLAIYKEII